jgi:hypothetical protein
LLDVLDEVGKVWAAITRLCVTELLHLAQLSLTLLTWLLIGFEKKTEPSEQLPILVEWHLNCLLVIVLHQLVVHFLVLLL